MSATTAQPAVETERVEDLTPVRLSVEALDSFAPEHLRDLKHELAERGEVPAVVSATGAFEEDCPLATQSEADDLREYVRVASFLGASRLEVSVETVADCDATETALAACAERARREGVQLDVSGPVELSH